MLDTIRSIIHTKNKISLQFPYAGILDQPVYFGEGEISDILGFGFSYVEHEDHTVSHIIATPTWTKKILREIDQINLCVEQEYIGTLWTAKLYISDKIPEDHMIFSNQDRSVVLDLNLNKMEAADADV